MSSALTFEKPYFPNANDCIPPLSANPQNMALKNYKNSE